MTEGVLGLDDEWRQVGLAARMHVTQPSVSELERGELARAGLATIKAYVEALGGSVEVVADFGDHRVGIGWRFGPPIR